MNVLLVPVGSAGDVHPFVGVGKALRERGHAVTVLTNGHFARLIEGEGLRFAALGTEEEYQRTIDDVDLWHPTRSFRVVARSILSFAELMYERIEAIARGGDTVVVASTLALGARIAQDRFGLPTATVHLQPSVFRSAHDTPVYPGFQMTHWPKPLKRLMYRVMDRAFVDPVIAPELNALRRRLGLPRVRRPFQKWLHSPTCVLGWFPSWYADVQPDWPRQTTLTGFPLYDESGAHTGTLPALDDFLAAGEPPIVFTPGSAMRHGQAFFRESVAACEALGRRGVLLTRFADQVPADLPPFVRHFDYVPFSRLLPHCAALVHHGGIGTTAQAFAAGAPQVIMPLAHDQPDNAARVMKLGVGTSIHPSSYQAPQVARALRGMIDDPNVRLRARALADRIRCEDGRESACKAIEALVEAPAVISA